MTDTTLIQVDSQSAAIVDSSTTLEVLMDEIKFYLRKMGQNVIEIGKRLILAKEKLPHGEWQTWLGDNFALSQMTANNFMRVAERFGKIKIDFNFGSTQMIQMLALPEGEEEKFIAEKSAEGTPVQDMSVKMLRVEIQKYKAKLAAVNGGVEDSLSVKQESVGGKKVGEPVQVEKDSSVEKVEESVEVSGSEVSSGSGVCVVTDAVDLSAVGKDNQSVGQNLLEQFFGMMKTLTAGGNLQELVEQNAEKDAQTLEGQLRQFAALYGDIQGYFSQWKSGKATSVDSVAVTTSVVEDVETVSEKEVVEAPIVEEQAAAVEENKGGVNEDSLEVFVEKICDKKEVEESDRHSIISALYQIALNDDENFTRTEYIGSLLEGKGFEFVPQMSTRDLHNVLYLVAVKFKIARDLSKRAESFQT